MVFQAIRDDFPARAAATFGAFTDPAEMRSSQAGLAMGPAIRPDFEERRDEMVVRRPAVRWSGCGFHRCRWTEDRTTALRPARD
jgi:hypothetical protein